MRFCIISLIFLFFLFSFSFHFVNILSIYSRQKFGKTIDRQLITHLQLNIEFYRCNGSTTIFCTWMRALCFFFFQYIVKIYNALRILYQIDLLEFYLLLNYHDFWLLYHWRTRFNYISLHINNLFIFVFQLSETFFSFNSVNVQIYICTAKRTYILCTFWPFAFILFIFYFSRGPELTWWLCASFKEILLPKLAINKVKINLKISGHKIICVYVCITVFIGNFQWLGGASLKIFSTFQCFHCFFPLIIIKFLSTYTQKSWTQWSNIYDSCQLKSWIHLS